MSPFESFEANPLQPASHEGASQRLETRESQENLLFRKVADGLRGEFDPVLSGAHEGVLARLPDKILQVKNSREFYAKMNGIDLTTLTLGEESFLNAEGMVGLDPHTFEPIMIHKNLEGESPKAIADKVCHESIHYLGFQLEETSKIEGKPDVHDVELLKGYIPEAIIAYRFGPLKSVATLYHAEAESALKILVYLPAGTAQESAFWEGAVDYLSKKIIDKMSLDGEYTAGYEQRTAWRIGLAAFANLVHEKQGIQYEEARNNLEQAIKAALLSGNETPLERVVSQIEPQNFLQRVENISRNLESQHYSELANRLKDSIPLLKDTDRLSSYEYFKSFVYNYAQYAEKS